MDHRYHRHNRRKYRLKVHIVLVTKYRKQLFQGSIADDVKQKIFDKNRRKQESHRTKTVKKLYLVTLQYENTVKKAVTK